MLHMLTASTVLWFSAAAIGLPEPGRHNLLAATPVALDSCPALVAYSTCPPPGPPPPPVCASLPAMANLTARSPQGWCYQVSAADCSSFYVSTATRQVRPCNVTGAGKCKASAESFDCGPPHPPAFDPAGLYKIAVKINTRYKDKYGEPFQWNQVVTLKSLGLSRNEPSIDDEDCIGIAHILRAKTVLNKLDLYSNEIGDAGATDIAEALKVNAALIELDLAENQIGPTGAAALADALKVNAVLNVLSLDRFYRGHSYDRGLHLPIKELKGTKAVETLDFSPYPYLTELSGIVIAKLLEVNAVLNTLRLNNSVNLGPTGATALADALKVNAVLNFLGLRNCRIGDAGATALAEALKVNAALIELDLSGNDIYYEGATALSEGLKVNAVLTTLVLGNEHTSGNNIGDAGATALAEALKVNAVLNFLDLRYCGIGDAGAAAVAEALKVNVALKELYLSLNDISEDGKQQLRDAWGGRKGKLVL